MPKPSHRRHDARKMHGRVAKAEEYVGNLEFGPKTRREMAVSLRGFFRDAKLVAMGRAWQLPHYMPNNFYVHTLGVDHVDDAGHSTGWPPPPRKNKDGG